MSLRLNKEWSKLWLYETIKMQANLLMPLHRRLWSQWKLRHLPFPTYQPDHREYLTDPKEATGSSCWQWNWTYDTHHAHHAASVEQTQAPRFPKLRHRPSQRTCDRPLQQHPSCLGTAWPLGQPRGEALRKGNTKLTCGCAQDQSKPAGKCYALTCVQTPTSSTGLPARGTGQATGWGTAWHLKWCTQHECHPDVVVCTSTRPPWLVQHPTDCLQPARRTPSRPVLLACAVGHPTDWSLRRETMKAQMPNYCSLYSI